MKINPETTFVEANGKLTQDGFNAIREALDGSGSGGGNGINYAINEWSGNIAEVEEKTITLVQSTAFAGLINEVITQSASGTATFTFKAAGVSFDGTASDMSTVEQSQVHATTFAAGTKIEVEMSSNSDCIDAAFTIKYTRTA